MPGPTAFPQIATVVNSTNQTVVTTAETVIATLTGINSRGANFPIHVTGAAAFTVAAGTTDTVLTLRIGGLTGAVIGQNSDVLSAAAGALGHGNGTISAVYTPALEVAGLTIVLTITELGATGNSVVGVCSLVAQQ